MPLPREGKIMTCKRDDIKNLLPFYTERRLPEYQLIIVEAHLDECQDCRKEAALLKMLTEERVPEPGEEFWQEMPERVKAEMEREMTSQPGTGGRGLFRFPGKFIQPRLAWSLAASVLALFVLWGVLFHYRAGTHRSASVSPEVFLEDDYYSASSLAALYEAHDMEAISAWADAGLKEMYGQMEMVLNGMDTDMYEDIFGLSARELERFRTLIDETSAMSKTS